MGLSKLFRKRAIAYIIDTACLGSIAVLILNFFNITPDWFWTISLGGVFSIPSIVPILFVFLLVSKDIWFLNASIGKLLVGVRVIKTDGTKPSFFLLIKRSFVMQTYGYVRSIIAFSSGKENFALWQTDFAEWEKKKFCTEIVENRKDQ